MYQHFANSHLLRIQDEDLINIASFRVFIMFKCVAEWNFAFPPTLKHRAAFNTRSEGCWHKWPTQTFTVIPSHALSPSTFETPFRGIYIYWLSLDTIIFPNSIDGIYNSDAQHTNHKGLFDFFNQSEFHPKQLITPRENMNYVNYGHRYWVPYDWCRAKSVLRSKLNVHCVLNRMCAEHFV